MSYQGDPQEYDDYYVSHGGKMPRCDWIMALRWAAAALQGRPEWGKRQGVEGANLDEYRGTVTSQTVCDLSRTLSFGQIGHSRTRWRVALWATFEFEKPSFYCCDVISLSNADPEFSKTCWISLIESYICQLVWQNESWNKSYFEILKEEKVLDTHDCVTGGETLSQSPLL